MLNNNLGDVSGDLSNLLSCFSQVKTYTPQLISDLGVEVGQNKSGAYFYGYYMQIGKLVLLYIDIKTIITESNALAHVTLPIDITLNRAYCFTVGETYNLTDQVVDAAYIRKTSSGKLAISLRSVQGGNTTKYKVSSSASWLKLTGFYFLP